MKFLSFTPLSINRHSVLWEWVARRVQVWLVLLGPACSSFFVKRFTKTVGCVSEDFSFLASVWGWRGCEEGRQIFHMQVRESSFSFGGCDQISVLWFSSNDIGRKHHWTLKKRSQSDLWKHKKDLHQLNLAFWSTLRIIPLLQNVGLKGFSRTKSLSSIETMPCVVQNNKKTKYFLHANALTTKTIDL